MDDLSDIPTRPMQVKILYTFDTDNKTTCLARMHGALNIPAVAIDEQTQVGVIELQQCIQTITGASPEILSQLESGDYTVYSTDYSEPDALLVGQGRLSTMLAASSSGTPVHAQTMITGRVLKNSASFFSSGVRETLEVKFKFTPLSRPALGGHADGMRSVSPATSVGFDPNAWNNSVQQNPGRAGYFGFDGMATGGANGQSMLDDMFGVGTGATAEMPGGLFQQSGTVGASETPTDAPFAYDPAFTTQVHSAPGSRSGSPIISTNLNAHNEQLRHQSFSGNASSLAEHDRPDSRGSVRSEYAHSYHQQQQPQPHPQQTPEIFYNEDGQSRKRAKVIKADWRGKTSFGGRSSDLRVTAATASSMHMHRPIAKRPSAPGSNLEPPPRVPTPVPQRTLLPHQQPRQSAGPRSMLRQSSIADSDFMSDNEPMSEAAQSSPEGSSPGNSIAGEGTPMEIPSSPPLIQSFNQRQPSSPGLPTLPLPRLADSGYGSDRVFNSGTVVESMEDDENRSPDADDLETASQYRSRQHQQKTTVKVEGSFAGDASDMRADSEGSKQLYDIPKKQASTVSPGFDPTPQPEASLSRRGSLALPQKPAPSRKRQPMQRSRTTYNDSEAGSPAPSDNEGGRSRGPRSGSGAPRRKIIEQRLAEAINNGETPVFCSHCGAIETPTWRKIYIKHCNGKPSPLDYVEGEGETIAVEITEIDEDTGDATKFTIRKCMKKTKTVLPGRGFEEAVVCNPCGLWFVKNRRMRPSDRWHRKPNSRKNKRKDYDGLHTDAMEPQSEAFFTDQAVPDDDAVDDSRSTDEPPLEPPPKRTLAPKRPRANSMQPQPRRTSDIIRPSHVRRDASFMRATQSSPVRFQGSQTSPIELEDTPARPTRRLLFPSPRGDGELKSLGTDHTSTRKSQSPPKAHSPTKAVTISEQTDVSIFEVFTNDQENMPPPLDYDDDLAHLFEGYPNAVFKSPASRRKTPVKTTPRMSNNNHFDEFLKTPTQSSRKRRALAESQKAGNTADKHESAISPNSPRYFLRSTPSRLERTPGGRSVSSGNRHPVELSPFSRHLSQMLGDATGTSEPAFTSPTQQYDFSDLPAFDQVNLGMDWKGMDDLLSSEFAAYDDPNVGLGFNIGRAGED